MSNGIYIAMAGAVAQTAALDVTANNVANAGSTGFKAERMSFSEALVGARRDAAFVTPGQVLDDPAPGALTQTGNPLDLAVIGDGYFALQTRAGVRYTRGGNFRVDSKNTLVNAEGLPLRKRGGGVITLPTGTSEVNVGADGSVNADGNKVGEIELARFKPGTLAHEGSTLYVAKAAPLAGPSPEISSGTIEQGNFNIVRGMVDLVRISRTYSALHRALENYKEMDDRTARNGSGQG